MKRGLPIKRVFITGGNRGIGRAIVDEFLRNEENKVVFTYRSHQDEAQAILAQQKDNPRIHAIQMDLLDQNSVLHGLKAAQNLFNGFDIVIHNAAFTQDEPFMLMSPESWQSVIQCSLNSFYYVNQAFLEGMIYQKWGRIITIVSISGESGNRGQTNYSASKGALIAATKALAKEVARKGVLVNAVSPGFIETEMSKDVMIPDVKQMIPVGRFGRPEEVASVVGFLASEQASYVNGSVIRVNGGLYT